LKAKVWSNVEKNRSNFTFFVFVIKKMIILRLNLNQKNTNKMKKVLSIVAVAALSTSLFVACGPSKEEIEARKKVVDDSVAAVQKQQQDSLAAVEAENTRMQEAAAAAEKAKADSTRVADSLAHAKPGKKH
jgi:hypothetical protein